VPVPAADIQSNQTIMRGASCDCHLRDSNVEQNLPCVKCRPPRRPFLLDLADEGSCAYSFSSFASNKEAWFHASHEAVMSEKLIPATQLAEYVYCSQAWYLKQHGVQVSEETRAIQAEANAWH
jgi:hypothetical protein